jgi:hypothetical protein
MPSSEIIFKYAIISQAAIDSDSDTRRCHLVDTFHILPFQLNKSLQLHIFHVATRVNVTTEPEIILLPDFVTVALCKSSFQIASSVTSIIDMIDSRSRKIFSHCFLVQI